MKKSLPEKYDNLANYKNIITNLRRINHYKELGRASYNNPLHMFENITGKEQKESIENGYNRKIREEAELYVQFKQQKIGHYNIFTCPCCGAKTLTTYDYWRDLNNNEIRVETAECSVCKYSINYYIGEPKEFDIMNNEIFETIK